MRNKTFIPLERINFNTEHYKIKRSKIKTLSGFGLMSCSFIIPDLSIGLVMGLCVLSPIGFKHALINKAGDCRDWVKSKYYKMRLRF